MDGRRGWWVVFGAFLALSINAGVSFFVIGVLLESILVDTGWTLTQVSIAITLWGVAAGLFSPLCGHLIDRFGSRPVMIFGTVYTFLALMLLSQVRELWQLYAVMTLAPIGAMSNTFIPVAAVVSRWFLRLRGIATGVAMLGLGAGGAVFPLLTNALLETYTWRGTYMILATLSLSALVPTVLCIRRPRETELPPSTEDDDAQIDTERDLTLAEALRTRSFWGIGIGDALTGLIFAIFNVQLVYFLTNDLGSDDQATTVFSAFQVCMALGTLVFGPLADRFAARSVLLACYFLPAIAVFILFPASGLMLALGFAVLAGLPGGGRSAVFPVTLVYCFGEKHLGAIWGVSNLLFMFGNALGPVIGGAIFDGTESTRVVYGFCIVTLVVSTALIALLRNERGRRHAVTVTPRPASRAS